jgi:hypothetical protein
VDGFVCPILPIVVVDDAEQAMTRTSDLADFARLGHPAYPVAQISLGFVAKLVGAEVINPLGQQSGRPPAAIPSDGG